MGWWASTLSMLFVCGNESRKVVVVLYDSRGLMTYFGVYKRELGEL